MRINREAATEIINRIPRDLRQAARNERKVIAKDAKREPVATAYRAAHGYYNSINDFKYNQELIKVKEQIAKEQYKKSSHGIAEGTIFG